MMGLKQFFDDEDGYLGWVNAHDKDGCVVNVCKDRKSCSDMYPMVHKASHKSLSSEKIGDFTTGEYFKICSTDRDELERWSQSEFGRPLFRCKICNPWPTEK